MFHKLKQFRDMRNQAKSLQNMLSEQRVHIEKGGIKITMDGNQKILSLELPKDRSLEQIEHEIISVFNDAIKEAQKKMVDVMKNSGNLDKLHLS